MMDEERDDDGYRKRDVPSEAGDNPNGAESGPSAEAVAEPRPPDRPQKYVLDW